MQSTNVGLLGDLKKKEMFKDALVTVCVKIQSRKEGGIDYI